MGPYIAAVLLALAAVLVVALALAAVQAIRIKAPANTREPADRATPEETQKYAETLAAMVQIPTVSKRGENDLTEFRRLQAVMREKFPHVFEKMELTDLDGNLLLRLPGKDPGRNGILLMGHQDVVPADGKDWKHDPFSGLIENDVVFGRGAMDCKCTVMAEFQAMDELIAEGYEPPCDVYLSTSVNEEISGGGVQKAVAYFKEKGLRLDLCMDEGGAIMHGMLPGMPVWAAAVGVLEKGYIDVKIKARGSGGHSSTPPKNTPIARLSAFVTEMEKKHPFKVAISPTVKAMFEGAAAYMTFPMRMLLGNIWLFGPLLKVLLPKVSPFAEAFVSTTFCFTMSGGSTAANVIPDEAYVVCNLRPSEHQNAEESLKVLKKYADKYDLECEVIIARNASNCAKLDGEEFAYLKQCIDECYPDAGALPYLMAGGTDCRQFEAVCDSCLRFCPIKMTQEQLAAMHAANETIGVPELAASVKFYKHFVKNHK